MNELKEEIAKLTEKLDNVYNAGLEGIQYVGIANYANREAAAIEKLDDAMFGGDT